MGLILTIKKKDKNSWAHIEEGNLREFNTHMIKDTGGKKTVSSLYFVRMDSTDREGDKGEKSWLGAKTDRNWWRAIIAHITRDSIY